VAAEGSQAREIRSSHDGFANVRVEDVGEVRLYTRELPAGADAPPATIRVGEPLDPVERALNGLSRTFVIVGSVTLALGVLAAIALAARIAAPLRGMARTAEAVDGGDLSHRLDVPEARDELRTVAESFNGMLGRLEEAFARQRRFVADASHELRTPLTVIKGQLEVLARQEKVEPREVQRVTTLVSGEVDRMERMAADLLELARSDRAMITKPEQVELGALAREVFESLAVIATRRLEVVRAESGTVLVDPGLISQLVRILTQNAIAHTSERGLIRLSVSAGAREWEIRVEDDGPGIPEAERALVFEPFYRVDGARTREAGGAGLGLAIAAAIAAAHNGSIEAGESELGGASFRVELPRTPVSGS
jgi:two-component system, OmpR family, sensor kinase